MYALQKNPQIWTILGRLKVSKLYCNEIINQSVLISGCPHLGVPLYVQKRGEGIGGMASDSRSVFLLVHVQCTPL